MIARIAGLLLLIVATAYALERWTLLPLRCARATWHGARALDAAGERAAAGVRASLRGCECAATHELFFVRAGASRSIADYRRALELDRRPETYFALGIAEVDALDRRAAIDDLTRACAFDPARLADIPYEEIRHEVEQRLRAAYGDGWLR
jgi:hypothetical protein